MGTENLKNNVVSVEDQKNIVTTKTEEGKKGNKTTKVVSQNTKKDITPKMLENFFNSIPIDQQITNVGRSKESIYKDSLFANCITNDDKKTVRRKLRNMLDSFIGSIIRSYASKNIDLLKKQVKDFNIFYKENYRLNDFSIESLISANTDQLKKKHVKDMLTIITQVNAMK